MTFSPIAARELLVAARNRRTFWVRLGMAGAAVLTSFMVFVFISATGNGRGAAYFLFRILAWSSFLFAVGAGIWLTADAIGRERRDGTLGLLFLTDLTGWDIILAKLLTHGLTAVGAVVAAFPVMTVAWLFGGLTGDDMWRTFLAILNTLFVSLSIGLAMSAYPQRAGESLLLTATWLAIGMGFLPLVHYALARLGVPPQWRGWFDVNLLTGFRTGAGLLMPSGLADPTRFWRAFWAMHILGWGSLFFGSFAVRRWAHVPVSAPAPTRRGRRWTLPLLPASGFRLDLLDINPILGLIGTPPALRVGLWILVALHSVAALASWAVGLPPVGFLNLLFAGWFQDQPALQLALAGFGLGVRALFAWHATEFFAEGRRSELLQTVCTTPMKDEAILRGLWLALDRTFRQPLIIAAVISLVPLGLYLWRPTGLYLPASPPPGVGETSRAMALGAWIYWWLSLFADLAAMVWAGAFLSLWLARRQVAFGVTFFLCAILPQLFVCVPSGLISLGVFLAARSQFRFGIRRLFVGERVPGERSWQPMIEE